ncbi:MAG: HD-GYP domain-containing protein [Planctomycetota bacterium]|jgi:putative two-component system response regulator
MSLGPTDLRVLVVDDEPVERELLTEMLEVGAWRPPVTSSDGREALERLSEDRFDILITDLQMPRVGGEELVRRALRLDPDLTILVLSGNGTIQKAMELTREGVFDFLPKPFTLDAFLRSMERARDRVVHRAEHRGLQQVIDVLLRALESKDPYSNGHSRRVADLAVALGRHLGLNRGELERLGYAALLHDIGKIGVPEAILEKEGPLTDAELAEIRKHPRASHSILAPVEFLRPCLPSVLHHHERWDGGGYPAGLAGERIPYEARIIAVVDAFDAMTSDRSYRGALSAEAACGRIREGMGSQFDERIARTFLEHFSEITETCPTRDESPVGELVP